MVARLNKNSLLTTPTKYQYLIGITILISTGLGERNHKSLATYKEITNELLRQG